jgi:hypothetical protein
MNVQTYVHAVLGLKTSMRNDLFNGVTLTDQLPISQSIVCEYAYTHLTQMRVCVCIYIYIYIYIYIESYVNRVYRDYTALRYRHTLVVNQSYSVHGRIY